MMTCFNLFYSQGTGIEGIICVQPALWEASGQAPLAGQLLQRHLARLGALA